MTNKTVRRLLAPGIAVVIVLAGCGGSDALGGEVVADGIGCQPTEVELRTDVPVVEKVAEAPEEVDTDDLQEGKGCGLQTDTYATLNLVGATATDAKVFTDTFADERPISASIGAGQLLPGLETGLEGMKVGGRRQVTLPAGAAYGKDGNEAQGIGPDQPLVFVVDLVAVTGSVEYCKAATDIPAAAPDSGKPTEVEMPVEAPTGEVVTTDLTEGEGDPVETGNYVTVDYLGVSCLTGQQFDSSWDGGEPIPVTLGAGGTIPGFATGIEGMKPGGLRRVEIPSALAYGSAGSPPTIAPDDPLVFVISLVTAADEPPATTTLPPDVTPPVEVTPPAEGASTTTAPTASTTTAPSGEADPEGETATTTTAAGAEPTTTADEPATTSSEP